jgi:hypothetical protein
MENSAERSAKLATKIVVALFKVIAPGFSTRAEGLQEIVDAVMDKRGSRRTRNALRRQLEDAIDQLGDRLEKFEKVEFSDLDDGERSAAIEVVCQTMDTVRITKADVIRKDLNAELLIEQFRPETERAWRGVMLSTAGTEYGRVFLTEACRFLVTLVRDMPDFTNDVLVENLTVSHQIHSLLERSIDSVVLPRYRAGTAHEVSNFEAGYLSDIVHRYKDMEIFGINLPVPELRRQPIDIAYITLMSSGADIYQPLISRSETSSSGPTSGTARVDKALGILASRASDGRRGVRIVLTGQAGCGKTTLTQWLAISAAQRRFSEPLKRWNSCTPFIVQLRNIFQTNWPEFPPEEVLVGVASRRKDRMPGDWLASRLGGGNTLLVLDGLDELSETRQGNALRWIDSLGEEYPSLNIIVTSRPEGLDIRWFDRRNYDHLQLLPMGIRDIRRCIESWFDAVMSLTPEKRDELIGHHSALLNDIERRGAVRDLAETPLVCAMLCAFYAYSLSDSAPESRGELYERVISTLVDARDRARNAIEDEGRRFYLKEKLTILQRIARHLTEHQISAVPTYRTPSTAAPGVVKEATAQSIIEDQLRSMPTTSMSAQEALNHLLKRSVIFREITPGEAYFVHRTLQEFLAAREYAVHRATVQLLTHIRSPQWRRIIAFSAEHLDRMSVSALIESILEEAEEADDSRELLLLAAECLSAAQSVEPQIVDRSFEMLRAILPPRTSAEAELIGRGNDGILPWLSGYHDEDDETVAACIRAAAVAGGPIALDLIVGYCARATSRIVRAELLRDWKYFDATEYARRVLSKMPLDDAQLVLSTTPMIDAVKHVVNARWIKVDARDGLDDFLGWGHLTKVEHLDCSQCQGLTSLEGIGALTAVKRLNLSGRKNLANFDEIGDLPALEELYLPDASTAEGARRIASIKTLRVLYLDNWHLPDFRWLARLPQLWTLSLNGCPLPTLDFCAGMPSLRTLRAQAAGGVRDVTGLDRCANLWRLSLTLAVVRDSALALPETTTLKSLELSGHVTRDDLAAVVTNPALTELRIAGPPASMQDLSTFRDLTNLRTLAVTDSRALQSGEGLQASKTLRKLDLRNTGIRSMQFVESFPSLREVNLDGCEHLSDVLALSSLPRLRRLTLPPMEEEVLDYIRDRSSSRDLTIDCEVFPFIGHATG